MKLKVGGKEYEYNKERYLEGLVRNFPMPGEPKAKAESDRVQKEYESKGSIERFLDRLKRDFFGLRNYPKDESEFTTPLLKLFTVPEGYAVAYKIGGKVRGVRPVRGPGYHLMLGLAGLLQSAHVIGTRPRTQDLIVENVTTADGVSLSNVDARLFYQVVAPEKTLGLQDYHEIVFSAAISRITDYTGDHGLTELRKAQGDKTNLIYSENEDGTLKEFPFPTVENVGVEMLELLLVDIPLDEGSKRLLEQEAVGKAEKERRKLNAEAELYEMQKRGDGAQYIANLMRQNPNVYKQLVLEVMQDFAQGPNNTTTFLPQSINVNVNQGEGQ